MTRRDFLNVAAASVLLPPSGYRSLSASEGREWVTTGHWFSELASFDDAMRNFMQARSISGATLAVTRRGRLVLARGYTYRHDDRDIVVQPVSLFRVASLSKPITAAALLGLAQEGRLDIHERVADLLTLATPPGRRPDPRLRNVTVLNLLQHLGGWDRHLAFDPMFHDHGIAEALGVPLPISKADIARYMTGQPLQHQPGTIYAYSNYGYSLLGRIIERIVGTPYIDYVQRRVLHPLNVARMPLGRTLPHLRRWGEVKYYTQYQGLTVMDNSRLRVSAPYGAFNLENMDAHGGWLASAVDLARFAATFDDPSSSPILDQESIGIMFGLPEHIDPDSYVPGKYYYGCGWLVRDLGIGRRNTWHVGSLPGSYCLLVRRWDGVNWCALFNRRDDPSGLTYHGIDGSLHAAADAVSDWPAHDLFDEYLPAATCTGLTAEKWEKCRKETLVQWKMRHVLF